jgi:CheY-like chemotaxis protein
MRDTMKEKADRAAKRVLVADPEGFGRRIVFDVLDSAGYEVSCVANGDAAVEAVEAGRYDLVVMEIGGPQLDGADAIRRIRTLPAPLNQVPIVLLTGLTRIESPTLEMHGADELLLRPVSLADLRAVVTRWTSAEAGIPA